MAEVYCGSEPCPLFLNSTCVFYTGQDLLYIGVTNNDTLQTIIEKINQAFQNAGVGYAFTNGLIQPTPFQPVQLGGALIQNTTIGGNFTLEFTGNLKAAKHITTGGSSSQFVKGDGTLDSTAYQPAANYITGLSGDVLASGPGVAAATLATVNFASGTFGNGNTIPIVTVNAKGLVTNITPVPVTIPPLPLNFIGDVVGSGFTGSNISMLLQNVNANPYNTITPLKFTVSGKGLVTSASPITASDIVNILGYYPGTSGTSGSDGTSGTSGTTGTSGTSGTSATSGTSGTTGTSGTSATSGTSGTSGTDGTGGTSGTSGSTGTSGTSGTTGTSGSSGTTGTSGSSGTSGTSGSSGSSGTSGTSATDGSAGTSGTSGTTGTSGSSGTSGTSATSGTSGTSGTTGTSGTSGLSGDRFKTTSTTTYTLQAPGGTGTITVGTGLAYSVAQSIIIAFDANNHNEAEVTSYDPLTGSISFIVFRLTGSGTYSAWSVNIDGASGGDGSSGTSGTSGTSATAGTSGTTGTSGSSGTSGTTGTSGTSGTDGTSGVDGSSGSSGTSGTTGTSGSSGTSGTTGTSGSSGTSGTSATDGTGGSSGTSGTSGTNGTGGTSGTSGSSATSGTSGTSGINGATGASGTSGTSGTSVAVSGTTNTMAKFTSATTIGNSLLTDDGSTLSYPGTLVMGTAGTSYIRMGRFPASVTNTGEAWIGRASDRNVGTMTVQLGGNSPSSRQFEIVDYAWSVVLFSTASDGNSYAASSFRAPIFYDNNNTAYYGDFASTSVLNTLQFGTSTNSGRFSGEGTWGATLRTNDGYIQFGPANPSHAHIYTDRANFYFNAQLTVSGGSVINSSDIRATIFYDLNDTGYYVDPNGTSYQNRVDTNQSYTYGWFRNLNNNTGLYNENTTQHLSSATNGYWDVSSTTNASSGVVGIRLYAGGHVNTLRGFLYSDGSGFGLLNNQGGWSVLSYQGGSYGGELRGSWTSTGDHRAPIFYDSNDTSYYVDPNSLSRIYRLQVIGDWAGANPNEGAINIRGAYPSMTFRNTVSNNMWLRHMDGSGNIQHYFAPDGVDSVNWTIKHTMFTDGTFFSAGSMRSPIFYDSDNTGYYVDPASTLSGVFRGNLRFDDYGAGIVGYYTSTRYQGVFAMGDAYKLPIDGSGPSNLYGITWSHPNAGGVAGNLNTHGALILENGSFLAALSGSIRARDDMRAPIFYDSNDTGYYADFNSTANNAIRVRGGTLHGPNTTWGAYLYVGANGRPDGNASVVATNGNLHLDCADSSYQTYINFYSNRDVYIYGNTGFGTTGVSYRVHVDGTGYATSDFRAPIFYDSNDTTYYLNPASTSQLNTINQWGWTYQYSNNGIYWANYSRGFAAPEYQGNSYGNITTVGTGRSGWTGYGMGNRWTLMSNGSEGNGDFVGIHDSSYGWVYYNDGGHTRFNKGYAQNDSSFRAPIFYDSANTAYYLDPNGGSYFAGSVEVANGYFLTNGVGGSMYMTSVSGSFGGYLRTSGHMVLDQMNAGYNVYVLDGNSVGVVKNAGSQSWSAFSDRTIKTVHSVIEDNLSKLESITPIYYSFNNFEDDKNRIGLIAQEVQEYFPELVEIEPMTEKLVLDYTGLIPVLLGAIKELKKEIDILKTN